MYTEITFLEIESSEGHTCSESVVQYSGSCHCVKIVTIYLCRDETFYEKMSYFFFYRKTCVPGMLSFDKKCSMVFTPEKNGKLHISL